MQRDEWECMSPKSTRHNWCHIENYTHNWCHIGNYTGQHDIVSNKGIRYVGVHHMQAMY